jgi:hypothetical protein
MSDTCGPMYEMPLAQYDPDGRCWKTSEVTSLWALPMSSLTLPTWGCLRDGALYELPTPERPTIERDCSSLPTPTASDTNGPGLHGTGGPDLRTVITTLPTPKAGDGERGRDLPRLRADTQSRELATAVVNLPTPTSQAAKHPTMDDRGPGTPDDANLWSVVGRLLPTPAVNDMGAGKDPQAWDEWAARQKAADGRPAPHGKSLEQEALRMLGTPTATMTHRSKRGIGKVPNPREIAAMVDKGIPIGASTSLLFSDGNTPSDDQHQPQLFDETTATA